MTRQDYTRPWILFLEKGPPYKTAVGPAHGLVEAARLIGATLHLDQGRIWIKFHNGVAFSLCTSDKQLLVSTLRDATARTIAKHIQKRTTDADLSFKRPATYRKDMHGFSTAVDIRATRVNLGSYGKQDQQEDQHPYQEQEKDADELKPNYKNDPEARSALNNIVVGHMDTRQAHSSRHHRVGRLHTPRLPGGQGYGGTHLLGVRLLQEHPRSTCA